MKRGKRPGFHADESPNAIVQYRLVPEIPIHRMLSKRVNGLGAAMIGSEEIVKKLLNYSSSKHLWLWRRGFRELLREFVTVAAVTMTVPIPR